MNEKIYSSNPAVDVLKRTGASGKFLVLTILMTTSVIATILFSPYTDRLLSGTFQDFYANMTSVFGNISWASIVGSAIAALPALLIAIGMWMIHFSCRNRKDGGVATGGMTLIRVILIIEFVIIILGLLAATVISILALTVGISAIFSWTGGVPGRDYVVVALIVISVITLVVMALICAYFISLLKVLKRAKTIAETGVPDNRVSSYLIVVLWIIAILGLITAVVSIFAEPLSSIAMVCSSLPSLLGAILLSEYKKGMTAVLYGAHPAMAYAAPAGYNPNTAYPNTYAAPSVSSPPSVDDIVNEQLRNADVSVNRGVEAGTAESSTYKPESTAHLKDNNNEKAEGIHPAPTNYVSDAIGDIVNEQLGATEVSVHSGHESKIQDTEDQANMAVEEAMKKSDAAVESAQNAIKEDVQAAKDNISSAVEDASNKVDEDLNK